MKRKTRLIAVAVMLAVLVMLAAACSPQAKAPAVDAATVKCSLTVDASTAMAKDPSLVEGIADEKGLILPETEFDIPEGGSAYDVMAASGLELDESQGYVSSINGLGEGDGGASSGWLYNINGEFPSESLRDTKINEGDSIVWQYTCDGGADLGLEF